MAGHHEAIGSIHFEGSLANSMTSAVQYIFREGLGQLEAIGSTSSEQLWAINRSLVVSGCWPIPCHRKAVLK